MRRRMCAIALAIAGTAGGAGTAPAQERITLVRLESRVEIAAPPAKIWARLVRGADLAACWPVWSAGKPDNSSNGRSITARYSSLSASGHR